MNDPTDSNVVSFRQRLIDSGLIQPPPTSTPALSVTNGHPDAPPDSPLDPQRAKRWLERKLQGDLQTLLQTPAGQRNHTLNAIAYSLGKFVPTWLDEQTVERALYDTGLQVGLSADEMLGRGGSGGTIRSGLRSGMREPRDPPIRPDQPSAPGPAGVPASPAADGADPRPLRTVTLTRASTIKVRPVRWIWSRRIALGTLALIGGREGIGKSTLAYQLAADVTRGNLDGEYTGTAKSVIVAATEDSWEHTIVPRLMAAGADLERVYRVDVVTSEGIDTSLSLPRDNHALEQHVRETDAAIILLDPLMSRLDGKLDTHKDAEVRIALEPLVAIADRTAAAVVGLIHVNKGTSTDPLTLLMASRAFSAVARAVLFVMRDPDDDEMRIMGQPKNNLGRTDLPSLTFRIDSAHVADTDEGPVWTGRIHWLGETTRSIADLLTSSSETGDVRTAVAEAGGWLLDFLTSQGGEADSKDIKAAGLKVGHSQDALKRARHTLKLPTESYGFPRQTKWMLPERGSQSEQASP